MKAHDDEVKRIADVVRRYRPDIDVDSVEGLVRGILNEYHPRIEWSIETFDTSMPFDYPFKVARAQIGSRVFDFKGRIHPRMTQEETDGRYKDNIRTHLGKAVAKWMDEE